MERTRWSPAPEVGTPSPKRRLRPIAARKATRHPHQPTCRIVSRSRPFLTNTCDRSVATETDGGFSISQPPLPSTKAFRTGRPPKRAALSFAHAPSWCTQGEQRAGLCLCRACFEQCVRAVHDVCLVFRAEGSLDCLWRHMARVGAAWWAS